VPCIEAVGTLLEVHHTDVCFQKRIHPFLDQAHVSIQGAEVDDLHLHLQRLQSAFCMMSLQDGNPGP